MEDILYQKTGVTVGQLALDLLSKNVGDRVAPVSEYQEKFGVSRGTIQNAFKYLKENGAIVLQYHGHMGAYIEEIHYTKLQNCCVKQEIMGIMPLPYSITYEGFATAIYESLEKLNFNMAYARGASGRIKLVEDGVYQFAVCSQYAAQYAMKDGKNIETVLNFGAGSFLSKHILLFNDSTKDGICDGMKVAYDSTSLDQSTITKNVIKGKNVELIEMRMQNTITALKEGKIDVGVWNYDEIVDKGRQQLKVVFLADSEYNDLFSTAVIVIKKGDEYIKALLKKYISIENVLRSVEEVKSGRKAAYY